MEPEEELPCACLDDPAPQRDDAAFAGDYALYRKAYKAWHARRQLKDGQRKKNGSACHFPSRATSRHWRT